MTSFTDWLAWIGLFLKLDIDFWFNLSSLLDKMSRERTRRRGRGKPSLYFHSSSSVIIIQDFSMNYHTIAINVTKHLPAFHLPQYSSIYILYCLLLCFCVFVACMLDQISHTCHQHACAFSWKVNVNNEFLHDNN